MYLHVHVCVVVLVVQWRVKNQTSISSIYTIPTLLQYHMYVYVYRIFACIRRTFFGQNGGARDFWGLFSVRLIRELDLFSVFVPVFGSASYTRVRLICANIRYVNPFNGSTRSCSAVILIMIHLSFYPVCLSVQNAGWVYFQLACSEETCSICSKVKQT